jgi:hypothetical protein
MAIPEAPLVVSKSDDIGPAERVSGTRLSASSKDPSLSDTVSGNERPDGHGVPELVGEEQGRGENAGAGTEPEGKRTWFAYLRTRDFWLVMLLG